MKLSHHHAHGPTMRSPTRIVMVEGILQPRCADGGMDHGSAGRVLVDLRRDGRLVNRLVWFGRSSTPPTPGRNAQTIHHPTHLEVVEGAGFWRECIFEAGRLDQTRLLQHSAEIDAWFGDGTTRLIDVRMTLIIDHGVLSG